MADVCVVHLVRAQNGPEPLARFVASYRAHSSGADHDLLVVFKGFGRSGPPGTIFSALANVTYRRLDVPDVGFDIGAYVTASRAISHRLVCFLNSYSTILADRWLRSMLDLLSGPAVGLVGASGTWESPYTNHLRALAATGMSIHKLALFLEAIRLRAAFHPFPNPHVRTNAFLLERETFLRVAPARVRTKMAAYEFESGRQGLTRRVLAAGLRALVAGRDGHGYEPSEWPRSGTFRVALQENLLVSDNQTCAFLAADLSSRSTLSRLAWGDRAGMDCSR
jgi:hypothetical protein